jgi:predicted permease
MSSLVRDLRIGLRMLSKSPGFSAVAVLAFALGIGANSAIFSVVNSVLLRPLDYADPERLVVAEHAGPSPVAPATFLDWKQQSTSFEQIAAAQAWGGSLRTAERPQSLVGLRVSANMFSLLGVPALKGRTFMPDEDHDGAPNVVVISHALWQRTFGGASDIVGREIVIDDKTYSVVGVMPPSFQFAPFWITNAEIWSPFVFGERKTDRTGKSVRVFARLKHGVAVERAQAEMTTIMNRLAQQYPEENAKDTVAVVPLRERVVGDVRPLLLVLLGTVAFVLLIACANVANLMLARASGRRREVAVRLALGASRWQLARQSVTESGMLATIGGGIGLVLAYSLVHALIVVLPPATLPRQREIGVDLTVVFFSAALSMLTGVLAGLIPAWHSSRGDVSDALKEGGRGRSEGKRAHRTRSILVVTEMALAFVLLIGAGLMVRSFSRLLSLDPGFDPANLLTLNVSVSGTRQAVPARRAQFYRDVLDRVANTPGVQSASAVNHPPITGDVWGMRFRVEGKPEPQPGEWPVAVYRVAHAGYFGTMRTQIVAGRDFTLQDTLTSPRVVIVNEALALKHWPDGDAVGKRIANGDGTNWLSIAGVVKNVKQADWQANPREEVYFPLLQSEEYLTREARHYESLSIVVRVSDNPAGQIGSVRRAIESVDPNVLVSNAMPMERAVANNTWRPRLSLFLLGAFAFVALILAVTGIYGVISHAVSLRTHEIGIRMALGASSRDVLGQSLLHSLAPLAIGIAIGVGLAIVMTRVMSTMLYGVKATDVVTFVSVAMLMLSAGLLAAFWPALRAARVDPTIALRHE